MSRPPTEADLARLRAKPGGGAHALAKEHVRDLPKWARIALAERALHDLTYDEAAQAHKRSGDILRQYGASPAGKAWVAQIEKVSEDPVALADSLIRASALGVTMDVLWALEVAREKQDHVAVGTIGRDLMDRIPELAKKGGAQVALGATQITIQLGGDMGVLEPAEVETVHTRSIEAGAPTLDAEIVDSD